MLQLRFYPIFDVIIIRKMPKQNVYSSKPKTKTKIPTDVKPLLPPKTQSKKNPGSLNQQNKSAKMVS